MDKVIQITTLLPCARKHNSLCYRVYDSKGLSPCLRTPSGGGQRATVLYATSSDGQTMEKDMTHQTSMLTPTPIRSRQCKSQTADNG